MSHDKLAYMANQIGRFFQSQKSGTAVDLIEDHLRKYWDPRMRELIVAQLGDETIQLDPAVKAAVERLRNQKSV